MDMHHPFLENDTEWSKEVQTTIEAAIALVESCLCSDHYGRRKIPRVPGAPVRTAQFTRIRPDQQVIHDLDDVKDEWDAVGPFLAVDGARCLVQQAGDSNSETSCVNNGEATSTRVQEVLHEATRSSYFSDVVGKVIGAAQRAAADDRVQDSVTVHPELVRDAAKRVVSHIWPEVAEQLHPVLAEYAPAQPPQQTLTFSCADSGSSAGDDVPPGDDGFQAMEHDAGQQAASGYRPGTPPPRRHKETSQFASPGQDQQVSSQVLPARDSAIFLAELDKLRYPTRSPPTSPPTSRVTPTLKAETERLAALCGLAPLPGPNNTAQPALPPPKRSEPSPPRHLAHAQESPAITPEPEAPHMHATSSAARAVESQEAATDTVTPNELDLASSPQPQVHVAGIGGDKRATSRFRTPGDAIRSKSGAPGRPRWQRWGQVRAALTSGALLAQHEGDDTPPGGDSGELSPIHAFDPKPPAPPIQRTPTPPPKSGPSSLPIVRSTCNRDGARASTSAAAAPQRQQGAPAGTRTCPEGPHEGSESPVRGRRRRTRAAEAREEREGEREDDAPSPAPAGASCAECITSSQKRHSGSSLEGSGSLSRERRRSGGTEGSGSSLKERRKSAGAESPKLQVKRASH